MSAVRAVPSDGLTAGRATFLLYDPFMTSLRSIRALAGSRCPSAHSSLRRRTQWTATLALGCRLLSPTVANAQQPAATRALVFDGVTVIDVEHGKRLPAQRVVVVGNRITAVGTVTTTAIPPGAQVVNATGKYVVPGFWDMHTHTEGDSANVAAQAAFHRRLYPLYIANGITGIRELGQRWGGADNGRGSPQATDSFRVWQRAIAAGTMLGPRQFGPSYDISYWNTALPEHEPHFLPLAEVTRVVDSVKAAGNAFLKYHGWPENREIVFAMLREARRIGLPVVGHISDSVTNVEAADSGYRSIEHLHEHHQCWAHAWWGAPLPDSAALDSACTPVVQAYLRNGTWVTPTMAINWFGEVLDTTKHQWSGQRSPKLWADNLRFLRTLHRLGLRNFLAGTDWNVNGTYTTSDPYGDRVFVPGLSARDEIVLLADGGLIPLEALQAATLNPARFFGMTDSLGTVAPDKLADLVLLDGDPLADITNVLHLWGVVANGQYLDHAKLMRMDPIGNTPGNGVVAADRRVRRGEAISLSVDHH